MNIPDNRYLGKLCKRGHEYKDTGKSLRANHFRDCIYCKKEEVVKRENKIRLNKKAYREFRKKKKAIYNNRVKSLTDSYIREVLSRTKQKESRWAAKDIPNSIVNLKRAHIKLIRLIRGV